MNFVSPAFLFGALVAALPIALHLLGRRPRVRVVFPAMRLLKKAPAQEIRRRRIRELVLLALRVAAVCLLALAFARPYFVRPSASVRHGAVVVAVDRSFSMSAPGQFERALSLARDAILHAPQGAAVGLVAFDDQAEVVVKPTMERSAVLRALTGLRPGYGATSYATALSRAAEALGSAAGQVVMVTDLQRGGWDRQDSGIPDGIEVVVRDAGGPSDNLSVSDVRRGENGLTAVVRNSGPSRRTGRARLTVNGQARGAIPFAVDGGSTRQLSFAVPLPTVGEARVDVDDSTGYQADNAAYALLDAAEPPAFLALVSQGDRSRGAFYIERALEVDRAQLFRVDSELAARFSTHATAATLDKYAGVILLGTRGLSDQAAEALRDYAIGGGGVLVAVDDQVEAAPLGRLLDAHLSLSFETAVRSSAIGILAVETRHPVLQPFEADALGSVRVERVSRTDVPNSTVLARFASGSPALVERREGAGRVLLFASDLSNRWNDLPLQPAFLPLVHQIARYLARDRAPAREFLVGAVPAGVDRQPGVRTIALQSADKSGRRTPRRIVVNVDPRESDVGRMSVAQFEQQIVRRRHVEGAQAPVDTRQAEQQQALWRLAIAFAIVALLVEGLLGKTVRT